MVEISTEMVLQLTMPVKEGTDSHCHSRAGGGVQTASTVIIACQQYFEIDAKEVASEDS